MQMNGLPEKYSSAVQYYLPIYICLIYKNKTNTQSSLIKFWNDSAATNTRWWSCSPYMDDHLCSTGHLVDKAPKNYFNLQIWSSNELWNMTLLHHRFTPGINYCNGSPTSLIFLFNSSTRGNSSQRITCETDFYVLWCHLLGVVIGLAKPDAVANCWFLQPVVYLCVSDCTRAAKLKRVRNRGNRIMCWLGAKMFESTCLRVENKVSECVAGAGSERLQLVLRTANALSKCLQGWNLNGVFFSTRCITTCCLTTAVSD